MGKDLKRIIYSMHPLARKVLPHIKEQEAEKIAKKTSLSLGEAQTGIAMLEEGGYVIVEKLETSYVGLDKFGKKYLDKGLPEIRFLKEIIKKPKKQSELKLEKDEIVASLGILKKNDLIEISKDKEMIFKAKSDAKKYLENSYNPLKLFKEDVAELLLSDDQKAAYKELKNRKGFIRKFALKEQKVILTSIGEKLAKEIEKNYKNLDLIEALDTNMLKTGIYKKKEFRHYDINLDVPILDIGRRHPMIEANNILRDVFVEMGFSEMQGPMVESEFWCFDALWIPQDHPARDDQDTFFLDGSAEVEQELVEKVRDMHEIGLKKGHTPKGDFSDKVTRRRILRTHSTATTFRTLYELGLKHKQGKDVNGKYFYIANNFRNEAVDATHLAEFYQGEGFIIGDDLSLADLMGFIKEYYAKLGITKIKFKPTFNPYTEPSMEAHYYDEKMKKWYALINSGIFRKENLVPFGLEDKTIIAWGMGASRVATLLAGKTSMRDITGATCDFEWLRTRPIMKRTIVSREK